MLEERDDKETKEKEDSDYEKENQRSAREDGDRSINTSQYPSSLSLPPIQALQGLTNSHLREFFNKKDIKLDENTLKRVKISQDGRIVLARKGNPHVSSACFNCRKSHLACDLNRPCGRCISSKKQDSCFDTQHKKRGRPKRNKSPISNDKCNSLSLAVEAAALTSVYPNMRNLDNLTTVHKQAYPDLSTLSSIAKPVLPEYRNQFNFNNPLEVPKIAYPKQNQNDGELNLLVDNNLICVSVEGKNAFCGLLPIQFLGINLVERIHPNDRVGYETNIKNFIINNQTLELGIKESRPEHITNEMNVHFLGLTNIYHLVSIKLTRSNGLTNLNIKKFDLENLLQKGA